MMKTVLFHDDGTSPERSTQLSESKQYNQKFVEHVLHKCLVARDHMATPDRKADQ